MFDLYILDTCPYCQKVMAYMNEHKIKFNKFDTMSADNALRLLNLGGKDQVPFLYNDETEEKLYESNDIIKYLENYKEG